MNSVLAAARTVICLEPALEYKNTVVSIPFMSSLLRACISDKCFSVLHLSFLMADLIFSIRIG